MKFPKRFFRRVLGNTLQAHHLDVEIRCLHQLRDKEAFWPKHFWCRSIKELENHWPEIVELNRIGYDIHFTVIPRLREFQGKQEHPLPDKPIFSGFWVDLDVGEGKPFGRLGEALRQFEADLKPTIAVESGSGMHGYYLFSRPKKMSKERADDLLQELATHLHADPAAARAKRLMRVPNTLNWKNREKPRMCRVFYIRKRRFSVREFEDLQESAPPENGTRETPTKTDDIGTNEASDYYSLFSPHVKKLVRRGEWATGLCPFHDDKHPSFSLNVKSGRWVCFACGVDGNWRDFKRRMEITDQDSHQVGKRVAEDYDWKRLPRFDPSKAPKTKWLVEDLVPEGGVTILVGAPGAFKSTFALLMGSAVSKGEEFLERKTRKRRVLYLDNENPPDVLKARNTSMKLEMEANRKLRLWSMYDDRPLPRILDGTLRKIVRKSVEEGKKVLIILDHFSSFLRPGEGGETTGQTSPLLQELKQVCAIGATVVFLHHTRKYEKDIEYGGGDLRAKCDAIHTLVLHQDRIDPNKKVIRVECFLKRHGGNSSFALRPRVADGQVIGFKSTQDPVVEERKRKREVLRLLITKNRGMAQHEIVKKAQKQGLSRDEAREILTNGVGRYWRIKISAHGAKKYSVLKD
jgi:hypothetical protein